MNQFQANLSVSFLSIISPSEDSPSQDLPDYELLSKARFSLSSRNWLGRACNFKDSLLADSKSLAELSYFVKLSPFKKCNLAWLFWLPSHSLTSGLPSTCCRRSTLERPMQISIRLTESATGRWLVQVLSLIILHWSLSIAFAERFFSSQIYIRLQCRLQNWFMTINTSRFFPPIPVTTIFLWWTTRLDLLRIFWQFISRISWPGFFISL